MAYRYLDAAVLSAGAFGGELHALGLPVRRAAGRAALSADRGRQGGAVRDGELGEHRAAARAGGRVHPEDAAIGDL